MITVYTVDAQWIFIGAVQIDPHGPLPIPCFTVAPPKTIGSEVLRWNGGGWDVLTERPTLLPPPILIPQTVSMAQARKALVLGGVSMASVASAIAAISDATQRELAQIDWEYSTTVKRLSPLVTSLGPSLNLTDAQIDALFIAASSL